MSVKSEEGQRAILSLPDQSFTVAGQWTHGPVSSVSYHFSKKPWNASVELARLKSGTSRRVVSALTRRLNYNFTQFGGAEIAAMAFMGSKNATSNSFGDVIVTPTGLYRVYANLSSSRDSQLFVASFSTPDFGGVAPAPVGEPAEVTGFTRVTPMNPSSGPVSVQLNAKRASSLAAQLDRLPSMAHASCHEDSLLYRIVFRNAVLGRSTYEADGYRCDAMVLITIDGKRGTPRRDENCTLIRYVGQMLPISALGTQRAVLGCDRTTSTGSVSGHLVRVGGPLSGLTVAVQGQVIFTAAERASQFTVTTSPLGTFAKKLPPGVYRAFSHSSDVRSNGAETRCATSVLVTVKTGLPTKDIEVTCGIK